MLPFVRRSLPFVLGLTLLACASEDPNILDPPPSSTAIRLRFLNLVPDGAPRRLVLERGYQTVDLAEGQVSATIPAPADSSFMEVVRSGVTEFRTEKRTTFSRNTIVTVMALGARAGGGADTLVAKNVIVPVGVAAVGSLRLINAVPDSNLQYSMRLGCPSGTDITAGGVSYRETSLYTDQPPGNVVVSVLERDKRTATERTVGLYSLNVAVGSANGLVVHPTPSGPGFVYLDESDTTASAERPITTVTERTGEVRLINLSRSTATAVADDGTGLGEQVGSDRIGPIRSIPTCVSLEPDRFTVTLADGRTIRDSTGFEVRARTSLIVFDSVDRAKLVVVPPAPRGGIQAGKARLRVVHAARQPHVLTVSSGARTDASRSAGYDAGGVVASALPFGTVGPLALFAPGAVPITVMTAAPPTAILHLTSVDLEADKDYVLIVRDGVAGGLATSLVEVGAADAAVTVTDDAVLVRMVNAVASAQSQDVTVGTTVANGRLFYGNSLTTTVPVGMVTVSAADGAGGTVSASASPLLGERVLAISVDGPTGRAVYTTVGSPLRAPAGQSSRRVINLTKDVALVSIAYDSIPRSNPAAAEHYQRDLAYGVMSPIDVITNVRRGSFFFYDAATFTELFRLPTQFTPLGNSATLIVAGSKADGYDVIVLQEF